MDDNPQESRGFTVKKKVDETWKNSVRQEKSGPAPAAEDNPIPDTGFSYFVSSLGFQALIALGEAPIPGSTEKKANLRQAKHLIDILLMLAEKTKNNLSPEEDTLLANLLYDLQMKFVKLTQTQTPSP